jgi:phospho-N-acetylmuramoyl-pentapeptide-transferase
MNDTLHIAISTHNLITILTLGFLSFLISMLITPIYTTISYEKQWWKRQRADAWSGGTATVYKKLHAEKHKRNIPTMAGLIFVIAITLVTLTANLSRGEAGAIGLIDDIMNVRGNGGRVAGMSARAKFLLYSAVILIGGWWFYAKLGVNSVYIPGLSHVHIGILVVALFWLVVVATANSVNITDGLDGLAGGLLVSSFAAYALGTALGIIAMQTDTLYVLPIIGAVYVVETGSVIINRLSRKLRNGKKVFLSSPIHHHFEAIGWPETKVTMRFWILGQMAGVFGLIIFLLGKQG